MGEVYFKSFSLYITEKHLRDAHKRVYLNCLFDFIIKKSNEYWLEKDNRVLKRLVAV